MKTIEKSKLHLHSFFKEVEKNIPNILSRVADGDAPVRVTKDLSVMTGVRKFLNSEGKIEVDIQDYPENSVEAVFTILSSLAFYTPLKVSEAAVIQRVFAFCAKRMKHLPRHTVPYGMIPEVFRLYKASKITERLALTISREIPPEKQTLAYKAAKGNALKFTELIQGRKTPPKTNKKTTTQKPNPKKTTLPDVNSLSEKELLTLFNQILASPKAKQVLADLVYEKTNNPVLSAIIKQIGSKQ